MPIPLTQRQAAKLILEGSTPSKKNEWQRGRNGMYLPTEVQALINSLILQARSQWKIDPVSQAHVKALFFVKDGRSDLDNKLTALLDILVTARVLRNDSIAHLASFEARAIRTSLDERVEVEVEW